MTTRAKPTSTEQASADTLLEIERLSAGADGKRLIDELSLSLESGKIHALMGANGAGKSSLAHVIAGHPGFRVLGGSVRWQGEAITDMPPHLRARKGIFLAFQHPIALPGVQVSVFLRESARAISGDNNFDAMAFMREIKEKSKQIGLDSSLLRRAVNDNFSGGERKRFEILQILLLAPKLLILDEIDSGLDVDALRLVGSTINTLKEQHGTAVLLITHYKRLLELATPDLVHVMQNGKIIEQGDLTLVDKIEAQGFLRASADE